MLLRLQKNQLEQHDEKKNGNWGHLVSYWKWFNNLKIKTFDK